MANARDLKRYSSIGADIRQVESVIVELERHNRVLSTYVTELRDLLETMEAVIRLVRAVARCSGTSTIGGLFRSLAVRSPAHLRSRKAAPRRRRREHAST